MTKKSYLFSILALIAIATFFSLWQDQQKQAHIANQGLNNVSAELIGLKAGLALSAHNNAIEAATAKVELAHALTTITDLRQEIDILVTNNNYLKTEIALLLKDSLKTASPSQPIPSEDVK